MNYRGRKRLRYRRKRTSKTGEEQGKKKWMKRWRKRSRRWRTFGNSCRTSQRGETERQIRTVEGRTGGEEEDVQEKL